MVKGMLELTVVEMFAIKHALQRQVTLKNKRLEEICTGTESWDYELEEEFNRLNKDIEHEKELVGRLEKQIKICKPILRA